MLTPEVPTPFPLRWGFTTRLDRPELEPPLRLRQVHGAEIHLATAELQVGDGLWTMDRRTAIGVRVADCVPVLLAGNTPKGPWVAALHAGWRGAVAGILRRGVALFESQGGNPQGLTWALGPGIRKCHFEVGIEVIEAAGKDPAWSPELAEIHSNGQYHFDLHGFLQSQAQNLGLDPTKDGSILRCTRCEPDLLYSYRGGDQEGRQWGWIEIV